MALIEVTKQQKTFIGKLRDSKTMCIVSPESNQVKEEIPSTSDCLIYVFRTEFLGQEHVFNFEKNRGAGSSLQEFAEQDDLVASGQDESQKAGNAKQQLAVKDNDKAKIDLIKSEFVLDFMSDTITLLHLSLLIIIRGLNVSIFNHFFLGQQLYQSIMKVRRDISKYIQFREFMERLERDFPLIKFVIKENPKNQGPLHNEDANEQLQVDAQGQKFYTREVCQLEDCAICQDQMVTARKLPCGHFFHQFCTI